MTPRESLEAAGMCSDCESNQCAASCRCPCHQKNANQAARLARDEAKETSDGRDERLDTTGNNASQRNSGILSGSNRDGSDTSAPVATSVSAPNLAQKFHEAYERLAPQFGYETRKASAKPWAEVPENNRKLMTAVCEEILKYASSSSAAPERKLWIESINAELAQLREWANKEAKRAEAAENKCAELESQVKQFGKVLVAGHAILDSAGILDKNIRPVNPECDSMLVERLALLRDSRDRLQGQAAELRGQLEVRETLAAADLEKLKELEDNSAQDEREIEALQESLRTVRQDLADRDGIIIGLQDVAAGKTRPLTDIEAELRGNKS